MPENWTTETTTAGYFEKFAEVRKSAIQAAEYSKDDSGVIFPSTPCALINFFVVDENIIMIPQYYMSLIRLKQKQVQGEWQASAAVPRCHKHIDLKFWDRQAMYQNKL